MGETDAKDTKPVHAALTLSYSTTATRSFAKDMLLFEQVLFLHYLEERDG